MSLNPSFKHVKKAYRYINNFLKNESDTFGEVISETEESKISLTENTNKEVNGLEPEER